MTTKSVIKSYLKITDLGIDESVSGYEYRNYEPVVGSNPNNN
jgi:hypothetical protein